MFQDMLATLLRPAECSFCSLPCDLASLSAFYGREAHDREVLGRQRYNLLRLGCQNLLSPEWYAKQTDAQSPAGMCVSPYDLPRMHARTQVREGDARGDGRIRRPRKAHGRPAKPTGHGAAAAGQVVTPASMPMATIG